MKSFKAVITLPTGEHVETTARRYKGRWEFGGDTQQAWPRDSAFLVCCRERETKRMAWYKLRGMFLKFQDYEG